MSTIRIDADVFEFGHELIDVTSMHRADTSWRVTDANGHEHQWYVGEQPATSYSPSAKYDTPTLIWVKDGEEYYEDDDEPHDVGHLECRICGDRIKPRYTADTCTQMIPGLRWCRINGEPVREEEFMARFEAAQRTAGAGHPPLNQG